MTLAGNFLLQPDGQVYYGGLNLVPGQPVYLYGANCASVLQGLGDLQPGQGCPGGRAINPNAFTARILASVMLRAILRGDLGPCRWTWLSGGIFRSMKG